MYELPYTEIVFHAQPDAPSLPLPPGAGEAFAQPRLDDTDPEVTGRIALIVRPSSGDDHRPGTATTLVIEVHGDAGWSVAAPLSSGQLHRLTNALAGRGTRSGIRPLAQDGERHVHLGGSPELLVVEFDGHVVEIPAGPKRALAKALRAYEASAAG